MSNEINFAISAHFSLRIPIRGYEPNLRNLIKKEGGVTNPYKGLWEEIQEIQEIQQERYESL